MIELSREGDIAILKMVHGRANAMDVEFCQALAAQFVQFRSSSAKAVVLSGQGQIFSAGVDLLRLKDGSAPYVRKFLPALNAMFAAVFDCPKPVVAAVNGHAIAGGCILACCTDRRLMASESGRIGVPELLVGVAFPALAFEAVRFVASPRYFREIIYGGGTYPPDAARERGLVDEIAPPDLLMQQAVRTAQALAALPAPSFSMTKRQMHAPVTERLERSGQTIDSAIEDFWATPEVAQRVAAYVARTLKKS